MFTACYDLSRSPASYDVVAFLMHVEAERLRLKYDDIELFITPGPREGFRADRFWPQDTKMRRHLLHTVVVPMCEMLPSVRSITFAPVAHNAFGHGRSMYGFRVMLEAMKVAGRPLRPRTDLDSPKWLYGQGYITITLREGDHWPTRNSNISEWIAAARSIKARGYDVIFVRDASKCGVPIEGFPTDVHAPRELNYRASLYRSAFCNFFVSNGPAWVAICADAPAIIMKPTTDGLLACYTRAYFKSCGLTDQLPNNPPHQRIVWKDDNAADIVEAFENFVAVNRQDQRITA